MIRAIRFLVVAICLAITFFRGDSPQTALAQFGIGPSEFTANGQPSKHSPAVAEKPSPCDSIPDGAVTKGSFTAWTEPQNPQPGQRYTIVVQIKGLENLERFPRCDLSGTVIGTDGYKDSFGGPTEHGDFPVKDQTVRLPVEVVPGAAELVKDTIQIKSKLLNEEQQIEINFLQPKPEVLPEK